MIPSQAEYLSWRLIDALADWRTTHGEARERARYELSAVIWEMRADDARRDAAFRAAVTASKQRSATA